MFAGFSEVACGLTPVPIHAGHEAIKDMAVRAMPQVMHQTCAHALPLK